MALNKVLLIGNVGKDPDVRHFEGGGSVANFSLATTERYKDRNGETKDVTEWHNIVCWRQLADLAENYRWDLVDGEVVILPIKEDDEDDTN